ncbi:hypothetical protein [Xanthobacter autotrophicus]|uniref:hypothetical protein n=1 Tax=Xanthobacter autotrophicus TaxID=280 RepID=UPI0024A61262|nr:hypothetical protein [Xanthobacter autotrophicus]MDI4655635.1 hypothetical protein [Xanthobacter autotrophicus]
MNRIKEVAIWLAEPIGIWALLGTILLWFLIGPWWSNCLEPRFRVLGIFLQLYGIWTVYQGIKDKHKLFSQPSMLCHCANYLRRFPLRKRQIVMGAIGATDGADSAAARLVVRAGPDASLSDRLSRLETNFDGLFNEVGHISSRLDAETKSTGERLSSEAEARKHDIETVNRKLEAATAGGLYIDLLGLGCVVLGTVIGGIAPEMADWFGDPECKPVPWRSLWMLLAY